MVKKVVMATLLSGGVAFGGMVDGVALIVNNEPITLYDIEEQAMQFGISKQEVSNVLIEQKLIESQAKKMGVVVDDIDLENALEQYANQNGASLYDLEQLVKSKGLAWDLYKANYRAKMLKSKLEEAVLRAKLTPPSREELEEFFEQHKGSFAAPRSFEVVKYLSTDKSALMATKANPMLRHPSVQSESERIHSATINSALLSILVNTPAGSFSDILPVGGDNYLMIYVQNREGETMPTFSSVENLVQEKYFLSQKDKVLSDNISRLKSSAKIKVIRLP